MRKVLVPAALLLATFCVAPAGAEEFKSGLQVGDDAGAFNVRDCTGPKKGTSLCYR